MDENQSQLIKTAKITGTWYLLMGVSGILGFLVIHSQVYVSGDPEQTLSNLIDKESLARTRLLLEFVIIVSQALTAVWFYKLFRHINEWAASTLAIFGIVNAVAIMISAISMASAIGIASSSLHSIKDKVMLVHMLQNVISNAWGVGGLFFGLWLFPMGYLVIKSKTMPVWLGRVIILGGIGYLVSTVVSYAGIEFPYQRLLVLPATIGEFWMIGYLLIFGLKTGE